MIISVSRDKTTKLVKKLENWLLKMKLSLNKNKSAIMAIQNTRGPTHKANSRD